MDIGLARNEIRWRISMESRKIRQSLLLLLTAMIWGSGFVAQSASMEYIEPFTMNAVRNVLAGMVLLPVIWVRGRRESEDAQRQERRRDNRTLLCGGILCGILLCTASSFQQFGIRYTTVGKAGFITAMYIIIVPILGIFRGKAAGFRIWLGVVLSVMGLYLLCMQDGLQLTLGDGLELVCAVIFSLHILAVDYYVERVDGVELACIQFFVGGILSGICMLLFENPQLSQLLSAWIPVCYAGLLSSGVGYTLQIVGQKGLNPTVASLILSLESVFSVLAGFIILGEQMSMREIVGCVLMFTAIILAQIPVRAEKG